jgi:hypothetical protein
MLRQNPTQVRFTQNDYMVDTLAPDRSDRPFGEAVLPRRGCYGLQDRGKPSIQQDKEQAIIVREPDATVQLTPHHPSVDVGEPRSRLQVGSASRLCDLNGEAKIARMNSTSAIIMR